MDDFLTLLRQKLTARKNERQRLRDEMTDVLAQPTRFKRDLNAAEEARFAEIRSAIAALDVTDRNDPRYDDSIAAIEERIAELEAVEARQNQANAVRGGARVTYEARTYEQHNEREVSFFRDLVGAQMGDYRAVERLSRHAREAEIEKRDVGTAALSGIVPPQYLVSLVAELARAGRPLANLCTGWDLPPVGMTATISRVTTGTAVAAQAAENDAVQETDIDDTLLSVSICTIAGQQDVSRQAIERGVGTDRLIIGDLTLAYSTELDRQIIAADGTSGTHLGILSTSGINSVTYTDASPTLGELWPKIADASRAVAVGCYRPADTIVMHPRRWAWIVASLGSDGRPLIDTSGAVINVMGTGSGSYATGIVGRIQNMDVVLDASIPTNLGGSTNEDRIIICHRGELHLWEDRNGGAPQTIRADVGAGNLTVKLVAYGFSAFTAGRYPTAVSVISGTGLGSPSL